MLIIDDISSLDIDTFVSAFGSAYEAGWGWGSIPSDRNFIRYNTTNGNLQLDTSHFSWSNADYYITLQYTKTTDIAGSGDWNTDGVPTVHYSTNEQVIGTWFDKPLYEKTIIKNNIDMGYNTVSGVLTSIAHNISNLKECVRLNMSCPKLYYCTGNDITSSNGTVIATFRVDATNVYCSGGNNFFAGTNDRYWYITIQYTKTTD